MEAVKTSPTAGHYVWGMFTTSDGHHVAGQEQIIAQSPGVDWDVTSKKRRRFERVGLSVDRFLDGEAYAFMPLDGGEFVFCRYRLSGLEEHTSRGQHIFAHYIQVTAEQLAQLRWNLLPVFGLFGDIRPTSQLETLEPLPLPSPPSQPERELLDVIRRKSDLTSSVIARLLNRAPDGAPVMLTPGPSELKERLAWLCGVALCLPAEVRQTLYFATAANSLSTKADLFFTTRDDRRAIGWDAAEAAADGPGHWYARWAVGVARERPAAFLGEMEALRECHPLGANAASPAERYDLAADFMSWQGASQIPTNIAGLDQLGQEIAHFWPCLRAEERVDHFYNALAASIRLTHQPAIETLLQKHVKFLREPDRRDRLAWQLSSHLAKNKGEVPATARFFMGWRASGKGDAASFLGELLEVVLGRLPVLDQDTGVDFWRELVEAGWRPHHATTVPSLLEGMPSLSANNLRQVLAIAARFINDKSLTSLVTLFNKTLDVSRRFFLHTIALVDALAGTAASAKQRGLKLVADSYGEVDDPYWLAETTGRLLEQYPVDSFSESAFLAQLQQVVAQGPAEVPARRLLDTLGHHFSALRATGEQDLRSLLTTAAQADSPLALDCLLGLLSKERLTQPLDQTTFDTVLKVNRRALIQRIVDNENAPAADTFTALEEWLNFLAQLAVDHGASADERRQLQAVYADAFTTVRVRSQLRQAEKLARVLDAAINPPLAEAYARLLWQLTDEVLYTFNHRALVVMRDAFAQSNALHELYRDTVSDLCVDLIAGESDVGPWIDFVARLRQVGCVWESATIYFYLLQESGSNELLAQYPDQLEAVLDKIPADFSLEVFGYWVYQAKSRHFSLHDALTREMARRPKAAPQLAAAAKRILDDTRGDKDGRRWPISLNRDPEYKRVAQEFLNATISELGKWR